MVVVVSFLNITYYTGVESDFFSNGYRMKLLLICVLILPSMQYGDGYFMLQLSCEPAAED